MLSDSCAQVQTLVVPKEPRVTQVMMELASSKSVIFNVFLDLLEHNIIGAFLSNCNLLVGLLEHHIFTCGIFWL